MPRAVALATSLLVVTACSQGNSEFGADTSTGLWTFSGPSGELRFDAPHHGGRATKLTLQTVYVGRLVDLYARASDGEPELVARDFLAPAAVAPTTADWTLGFDDFAGRDQLVIAHPRTAPLFLDVVAKLDAGLERVLEHGLAPSELPPYTAIARNATLALEFDDLLDPASLDAQSVRLALGGAGDQPFAARLATDPLHGALVDVDGDGARELRSTRVFVDAAISAAEADASSLVLPVQPLGLPAGSGSGEPNVVLRLATVGERVLANLSGATLAGDAATLDTSAPTHDVVRAFATGPVDSAKSFLSSATMLALLGRQGVQVTQATHQGGADWQLDLLYATPACAATVERRDALVYGDGTLLLARSASNPPSGAVVTGALFRVVSGSAASVGAAELQNKWRGAPGQEPACFLTFTPAPLAGPARGVAPNATVSATFNLPLDPRSLGAFDEFAIVDPNEPSAIRSFVVGALVPSVAGTEVVFTPSVPFAHQSGSAEAFEAHLRGGPLGLLGLGGAELLPAGLTARFQLDPAAATVQSGGIALRFSSADEDVPSFATFPTPEVRGQFLFDLASERILPRPVTHFAAAADPSNPIVGTMLTFTQGVQTPLVPLGSKLMNLWRYHDVGFSLIDEATMNVDVEGLAWSPHGGSVVADQFPDFQIALTHSRYLPDEQLSNQTLLPTKPMSGVVATFAQNVASATNDPLTIVHPKAYGYVVDPTDTFVAASGMAMQPWPLNRQLPVGASPSYYTWRDTAVQTLGAPFGYGAETGKFVDVVQLGQAGVPYAKDQVPTIGLPLLMEFRCYPTGGAVGLNDFQIAIAINSSAAPFFRAFSSGGTLASGQSKVVDPDAEPVATGGVSSSGFPTPQLDNVFYYGQADFVVRVSRAHTIWFDSRLGTPSFATPVLEPTAALQPAGTQIVVAYRGATAIGNPPSGSNGASWVNADNFDFYGESRSSALGGFTAAQFAPSFLNGDSAWKSSISTLDGARYVQARISFIANAATGATPELASFGLAYQQ
ncbi:MAG: hypothetical protein HZA52_18760 [Planctomycetes bacterium]|nr:hypothetical protein [Planctomycetota bacterium]